MEFKGILLLHILWKIHSYITLTWLFLVCQIKSERAFCILLLFARDGKAFMAFTRESVSNISIKLYKYINSLGNNGMP